MPSSPEGTPQSLLAHLLRQAGETALRWHHLTDARQKADGTQVTEADRAAEEVLVEGLVRAWPTCAIVSEEGALVAGHGGTWYVDPIDGTTAFIEGLAHWGPTISLVQDGKVTLGAFHQPLTGEQWYVARGEGAWRGQTRLRSGDVDTLGRYDSLYLPSQYHHRLPIDWPGKVRALGCTAAHLALVASGGATAAIVARWKLWDVGAGILMVEEAGRSIRDLTGQAFDPISMARAGTPFIAGAPTAVDQLVAYVARSRALRAI